MPSQESQTLVLAASLCVKRTPERVLGHEPAEPLAALDLHDRQQLAVLGLEPLVAGDVDLLELERPRGARCRQDIAGVVAEVAARRVVERHAHA